jgi:hypothetical protein
MPEPNAGESEQDFIGRCMSSDEMNSKFPDQKQRAAVCYSRFSKGKKSMEEIISDVQQSMGEEALAASAYRHRAEIARLSGDEPAAAAYEEIASDEDTHYDKFAKLISPNVSEESIKMNQPMAIKFIDMDSGVIEGWLGPYRGPYNGKDLQNQFFDEDTDFCLKWFDRRPMLYQHGLDPSIKTDTVGYLYDTTVKDLGLWTKGQLDRSHQYWEQIKSLIMAGKLFFSSGAVPHLVQIESNGHIKRWPVVEGSLTPTPAHPLATVDALKAIQWLREIGISEDALKTITIKEKEVEDKETKALDGKPEGSPEFKKNPTHADPAAASMNGDKQMPPEQPVKTVEKVAAKTTAQKAVQLPQPVLDALRVLHDSIEEIYPGVCAMDQDNGAMVEPNAEGAEVPVEGAPTPPPTEPGQGQGMSPENHVEEPGKESEVAAEEGSETPGPESKEPPAEEPGEDDEAKKKPPFKSTKATKSVAPDATKALLDNINLSIKSAVEEATKPLKEQVEALKSMSANKGPVRAVPNPRMGAEESNGKLQAILDDPRTPLAVKSYLSESSAVKDLTELMKNGPVPIKK